MQQKTPSKGALDGVRVIDFTRMLSGPFCTMLLADHGAEVIKIEPFEGDTARANGPFRTDDGDRLFGGYFQSINRNKKSIAVDLKSEGGRVIVRRMVATADILVENFRPGVMERLGFGYDTLRGINPRLVYAAIRGYGDPRTGKSPYASWPAYDVVAQAMGGLMGITGVDKDHPMKVGPGIGDIFPGTLTALGVMLGLHSARQTGQGQFLDVAMYDAILALCERIVYQYSFADINPRPEGNEHPLFAPFGLFQCRDGWVSIACPGDEFWKKLAPLIGFPELAEDERCATKSARQRNREFINKIVTEWVAQRTKKEIAEVLGGRIPFGPVHTAAEIFEDPHVKSRQMLVEIEHPGSDKPSVVAGIPINLERTPGRIVSRAPFLGEHADSILTDLNFSALEIEEMRQRRSIL